MAGELTDEGRQTGSGVRPDQALAIAQALEKLIDEPDGGSTGSAK